MNASRVVQVTDSSISTNRLRCWSIVVWALLVNMGAAAADDLIPRRTIFASVSTELLLSPDGQYIAYGRPAINRVRPLESDEDGSHIRLKTKGNTVDVRWAFNDRDLLFVKRMNNTQRVVSINLDTRDERDLSGAVGNVASIVALHPSMPETVLLRVVTDNMKDELWHVNIVNGESSRLMSVETNDRVFADAELRPKVLVRKRDLCKADLLRSDDNGVWQVFRTLDCDDTNIDGRVNNGFRRVISVSDDGETLYLTDATGRDKSVLLAVDIATNHERILASNDYADMWPEVLLDINSGAPLASYAQFGQRQYSFLDAHVESDYAFLEEHFGLQVSVAQRSLDGNTLIVSPLDGGPPRYFAYRRDSKMVRYLMSEVSTMDEFTLADRSSHTVTTRDGLQVPIHLFLPHGTDSNRDDVPDAPLPTVIYVHGGPSSFLEWDGWNGQAIRCQQLLANRGYAALRVEFRGAGGFGKRFREKGNKEWGRASLDDVIDIAKWCVDSGISQDNKIGIWGFSFGGHAVISALAHHPDVFACGFSWAGPTNLEERAAQWAATDYADIVRSEIGDERTEEGRAALHRQSPIHYVENIQKPLLIAHGGKDTAVPITEHIEPLIARLDEHDKAYEYLFYAEEGHAFTTNASWISLWAEVERFFAGNLGGKYESNE